ncbi:uncharacterized protein LOC123322975 [Coccinella septempunctata]|uniref:uncharacterized protein LOC123322975 n=1 Tax=Coccinella septempunctata TaxID=41139 RepID=UPI001D08CC33|nr:uncharacterized protein LOC123322975 [Coccinella septempunctata]
MPKPVILRQFLELQPKTPHEVRQIWTLVHILCLSIAGFSGWLSAYTFGLYLQDFDFQCILFATLSVTSEHSVKEHNLTIFSNESLWSNILKKTPDQKIDIKKSKWGEPKLCNFVQFLHVASMLSSVIWIVFFAISGRGSKLHGRQIIGKPYRLVFPFLFWSIISSLVIFVTNSTLTSGLIKFCSVIEDSEGKEQTQICFGRFIESYRIFFGHHQGTRLFTLFFLVKFGGYVEFIAWLCNALWTCLRVYLIIDYKFYMVTVWKYEPDRSERLKHRVTFVEEKDE